ncbi:transcriptional repressor [Gimibacter soli]|uniref:Transcriptional repressor n=1 Tax=Gimibacter soli TaxID=3024400 RepID=A0AAE9XVC0_9PROT|nr:transcriptional repressor [Gimibacter soli]WCL53544.1 transcriptional repressor [Gimibacter soli]
MGKAVAHDHRACIGTALAEAERLCAARGKRFTELRRQVLRLVWQGHRAVKAYDLLEMLPPEAGSPKPTTVYRALDFLMKEGFVHKIESLNAFIGCPHPGDRHVSQFLICDACGNVAEVTSPDLDTAIMAAAGPAAFSIRRQTVELHGLCAACRQN